jgi:hypothetical protein
MFLLIIYNEHINESRTIQNSLENSDRCTRFVFLTQCLQLATKIMVSNLSRVCSISRRESGPYYTPDIALYNYSTFAIFNYKFVIFGILTILFILQEAGMESNNDKFFLVTKVNKTLVTDVSVYKYAV